MNISAAEAKRANATADRFVGRQALLLFDEVERRARQRESWIGFSEMQQWRQQSVPKAVDSMYQRDDS